MEKKVSVEKEGGCRGKRKEGKEGGERGLVKVRREGRVREGRRRRWWGWGGVASYHATRQSITQSEGNLEQRKGGERGN